MKRLFGCHVSAAGGLANAVRNAETLGVNVIQIHPSPPQRWNFKPYPENYEQEFLSLRSKSKIKKVFFHAIYLINLASGDKQKLDRAKLSLIHYLDLSARIEGDGVIVHVGSLKDVTEDKKGFVQAAKAIDYVLSKSPESSRLILEVAAGSGRIIGSRMEELREIYDLVERKERVGFGLDSQHMWASGYDLKTNLTGVVEEIREVFGLDKVWAIHLNDSLTELGSKKDRHANIGEGLIGKDALKAFLNYPGLKDISTMLETPALKSMDTALEEVRRVQALLE